MSALLWKSYLEDDLDHFQQLLDAPKSGFTAQGRGGTAPGTASAVTGDPTPFSAGSPNLKGKVKSNSNRGHGRVKQGQGSVLTRADVNSKDAHGTTLLHRAASSTADTAQAFAHALLRSPWLDLYIQDHESGWTALHRALYAGNITIARVLMQRDIHDFTSTGGSTHAGGLIKIKDQEGNSPFDVYARTIAARIIPHGNLEPLLMAGSDDEDEDEDSGAGTRLGDPNPYTYASLQSIVNIDGDEVFMFGSNKNMTLGFGDEDDRQFPERVALKRPDILLQRFRKEHLDTFLRGPLAESDRSDIPTFVSFRPIRIQDVQLAKLHSAVLSTDPQANLYICGFGSSGRLGTGDQGTRFTFTNVLGGGLQSRKVVAVGLGQDHTLAVTSDGEVLSWGSNRYGQLGYAINSSDQKDDDPVQLSPRQLFGSLKRETVQGCAASRIHSVVFTSTSLFTFGKNDGQLGLVDSDARLLETQITPRKVAASLFSSSILMVTAIDKATTCLLENHDVWIFANFGYRKVAFPLHNLDPFIRDSFSAVDRRDAPNKIIKICSGGDTICALGRFGEIFSVTVSQKMDSVADNPSSTTHPNKIRGALSMPYRVWSPRKEHMAATDVSIGQDGSVVLCTQAGSVWRKVRRAKIKDSNPLQIDSESNAKDYKFSRVPGLTEICGVRSNAFGAFAAIRKESDVLKAQIQVSSSNLWDDMFPLLSFSDLRAPSGLAQANPDVAFLGGATGQSPVRSMPGFVRLAVLTCEDIETTLSNFFEQNGPSRSSDYDVKIGSNVSEIRIPCHQFVLMGRSAPLRRALLIFKNAYFSKIVDVLTVEYDKEGIASVIFQGLDILSVINIVFYLYTDNIIPVWNMARMVPQFGPRYRQVRMEVMKVAAQLELRGLEKAARLMSEPAKNLHRSFDIALSAPEFLDAGDIEIQLKDHTIRLHSAFVCQRCPFFEGMFHGRARGGWLASRRQNAGEEDDLIIVDFEHIDKTTFLYVVRYLYGDVDEELFSDNVENSLDDFLDTVLDVLAVANELMIKRLSQICQKALGKYVTTRNVCWLLNAVAPCSVTEFKNAALEYICLNLEGMMENRLLDELDEDILNELGAAIRANQLAFLPVSKSGRDVARLFDEYPDLAEKVERDRKVRIDYMMLRSHLLEDDAKMARLERSAMRRSEGSSGDLMFDMDEDNIRPSSRENHASLFSNQAHSSSRDHGTASPSSSMPREDGWHDSHGKTISPAASSLDPGSSVGTDTPPSRRALLTTSSPTTPENRDSSSPWTVSSLHVSKLNMKEIMEQASESKTSNISAAIAAASPSASQVRSSVFGKISQKERKRQMQAQKVADTQTATALPIASTPQQPQLSPWRVPPTSSMVSLQQEMAKSSESVVIGRRRASGSPSLTMRQTLPGNVVTTNNSAADSAAPAIQPYPQRRSVSSPPINKPHPLLSPPSTPPAKLSAPSSQLAACKSSSIVPKSIRHIPPTTALEPTIQSSMADILTQQQKEKRALQAATARRSLQEIQEEQAFQEWWDQEEAATKAQIEREAAAAAASEAKAGRARGGRARGGRGRGRRGSAAMEERDGSKSGDTGIQKDTGSREGGKSAAAGMGRRAGGNSSRTRQRGQGNKPAPVASSSRNLV